MADEHKKGRTNPDDLNEFDELSKSKGRGDDDFFSVDEDDFYIDLSGGLDVDDLQEDLPHDDDEGPYYTIVDEPDDEDYDDDDEEVYVEEGDGEPDTRRRMIQIGGIVGVVLLALTFSMFLLSNAFGSNGQVDNLDTQQIEVLVGDLFSESGNIKRDLSKDELDIAKQYVNNLDEGTLKVELRLKLTQAEEQLSKQTQALALVQGVMKDGQPYIDLNRNSLQPKVDQFPMNFDTAYAQELSTKYYNAYDVIEQAHKLEDELYTVINNTASTLADIDAFRSRIEQLPSSQLKTKLSRAFNNKVEELKQLSTQSKDEESRKLESESLSRLEESRQIEESILSSIDEQNSRESESASIAESESLQKELELQESIRQESIRQESIIQESIRQESIQSSIEASIQESIQASIEASIQESIRQEQNNQTPPDDTNDETVN